MEDDFSVRELRFDPGDPPELPEESPRTLMVKFNNGEILTLQNVYDIDFNVGGFVVFKGPEGEEVGIVGADAILWIVENSPAQKGA